MLRVAATLLALLAVLPAATPLIGGYKAFFECRNLTHLGPGKWPPPMSKPYNFTGLLVMPEVTCSCSLVTATFLLSCSLCRFWKEKINFLKDIEEDGSEVRLGTIQGEVSPHLYQRQLVKRYYHCEKKEEEIVRNPLMLIEVQEPFDGWSEENYPGYYRHTPFSQSRVAMIVDVVGYEHSANLPIYHQAAFDATIVVYNKECKLYGRSKWDLSDEAICTWDVSPVRTVCNIDRGGPVLYRRFVLGIIVGIVDDMETPGNYCGEGRVHYNVFFQLREYADWMKAVTGREAKFFNLIDGRILEDSADDSPRGGLKPEGHSPQPMRSARKPSRGRSGAGRQLSAVGPLILTAANSIARLANQY